jgi:hypothetical protein
MTADALDQAKVKVTEAVDRLADDLEAISHQIHATPELCFHEEKAAGWLTAFLEKHGARVERGVGGLPTAFRATIEGKAAGPTIAIMAEYDALPNIGHACGHNVIATAGTGRARPSRPPSAPCPSLGASRLSAPPPRKAGRARSSSWRRASSRTWTRP